MNKKNTRWLRKKNHRGRRRRPFIDTLLSNENPK
jgi:hypothetical protein